MRTPTILLLLAVLGARVATASDDVGVVIAADAATEPKLGEHVESWLREHAHTPKRATLPAPAIASVRACFDRSDEACARTVLAKFVTTPTLVFAKADVRPGAEGTRNIMLTAYWLSEGREAIADQRYCERCTAQLLAQSTAELMTAIATSGQHNTGHLALTSEPTGAKVLVDGVAIGATPVAYDLEPGNHQLTLTASGHEVETRQVAIRDGETTRLAVPLVAITGAATVEPTPDVPTPSRAVPVAIIAGGAALAIAGGILVATDEDASPTGPLEIRNTAPLGVALVATGGAAIVVGAILWKRIGRTSAPVATVSGSTAYFGWSGRF